MTDRNPPVIADYDFRDYDYRSFWEGRRYEHWAEAQVLSRLMAKIGHIPWLVDFGGGFGRNAAHYLNRVDNAVLVDYSSGNLRRAAELWPDHVASGRLTLVRADLYHLPFGDDAFDCGLVIRVLHHLTEIDAGLGEMGRVVARDWIVDVPIKNHLLARLRSGRGATWLSTGAPRSISSDAGPYWNFSLKSIQETLGDMGFDSSVVASVNNFRRWERAVPQLATRVLWPIVCAAELGAQRVGRGWWGPSQFLWATKGWSGAHSDPVRRHSREGRQRPHSELGSKLVCPVCRIGLVWSETATACPNCRRSFRRDGAVWDFVFNR
ncbi:MAG TPA: methyltransferase domain-containing protein [Candidatus Dormibacteraeota bacterium]|jgi:SAM-dependent methyltransferase|nr:methyltransferase domain-containing protein [Candidatus Dormibacteraeota bacterium]